MPAERSQIVTRRAGRLLAAALAATCLLGTVACSDTDPTMQEETGPVPGEAPPTDPPVAPGDQRPGGSPGVSGG